MATVEAMSRLTELPAPAAVALTLQAEHYFDAVRALLDVFAPQKKLSAIYITATLPSKSIINALKVLDVDLKDTYFVDCVASLMLGAGEKDDRVVYVESPTMLENMMLKVEFLIRKLKGAETIVILDSVNSLAINNGPKMLSEFLHILTNHLRSRNAYTVILSMQEYTTEEIRDILNLVCDETIPFAV